MKTENYYQILGVKETATSKEIKSAYYKLALEWHPDRNKTSQAEEKTREIIKAYEILGDEKKRKLYDGGKSLLSEEEMEEAKKATSYEQLRCQSKIKIIDSILLIRSMMEDTTGLAVREKDLDPSLWHPYNSWMEKLQEMEFSELDSEGSTNPIDQINDFQNLMIDEIQKTRKKAIERRKKETEIDWKKLREGVENCDSNASSSHNQQTEQSRKTRSGKVSSEVTAESGFQRLVGKAKEVWEGGRDWVTQAQILPKKQ